MLSDDNGLAQWFGNRTTNTRLTNLRSDARARGGNTHTGRAAKILKLYKMSMYLTVTITGGVFAAAACR